MKKIRHYKILELLGSGGMGQVYKAFDPVLEREVAIKIMCRHLWDDKKSDERFLQEARAVASLVHPNIGTIYEVGKVRSCRYIVMEYIQGTVLTHLAKGKGTVKPEYAIKLVTQILSGLTSAHGKGILHRDIKPDNIIVAENDIVKILDFGIAKMVVSRGLTATGELLGTVEYMAPEQMLGETINHRCDIYATGVVLYQILTKRLPFTGENPVAILYKAINEDPVPASRFNSQVSHELDQIILKAISKNQEERWQSAEGFSTALQAIPKGSRYLGPSLQSPAVDEFSDLDIGIDADKVESDQNKLHPVFVGRENEFRRLVQVFERASRWQGQTVILKGEAGVGKSTLVNRFRKYAELNQAWVLYGKCLYREGFDPYLPYLDALRAFFRNESHNLSVIELNKLKSMVREEVPLLREFTELSTTSFRSTITNVSMSSDSNKNELVEALYHLLLLIASVRPVVFIIDDLHLANEASLRLFHYLSHHLASNRILLLGISRTERYDLQKDGKPKMIVDMLARINRETTCEQITLNKLNKEGCELLIDKTLTPSLFTEEFYELTYRGTKGNPFFVIETLKHLRDSSVIFLKENVWHNKHVTTELAVPKNVEDIFIQRLSAMNNDETNTLQVAAVIGYNFNAAQLSRLLEITKINLLKILQRVETELQIIASAESGFTFEHPMLRDMLYKEIPLALRREYHLMIALDMKDNYDGDFADIVGEIAQHLRRAGEHEKAAPLLYQAAQRFFELAAYRNASLFIIDYLDSIGRGGQAKPESAANLDLHFKLGRCYEETGRWNDSLNAYKVLLELSEKKGEPGSEINALECIGRLQIKLGDYDKALHTYGRCLKLVEKHKISNVIGRLYNSLGIIHYQKEEFEQAQHYFEQTIQEMDGENSEYGKANALINLGIIASVRADYDLALESYEKALKAFLLKGDIKNQARVYHNIGTTYADQDKWSKSRDAFERCLQLTERVEDKQLRALIYLNLGKVHAKQENISEAKNYAEKALKMFKIMGDVLNVAEAYHVFSLISTAQGNFSEAELFLNQSISLNDQKKNLDGLAETYKSYGKLCTKRGELKRTKQYYRKAIDAYQKLSLHAKAQTLLVAIEQLDLNPHDTTQVIKVVDKGRKKRNPPQKSTSKAHKS